MIEHVNRDEIIALRHAVLRPGLPVETVHYPEDESPEIFHLADRDADGSIISCVSFFRDDRDGRPAWRFRGMATVPERRSAGVGGRLLEAAVVEVARRGGELVWCNGRVTAAAFYQRHGFVVDGDEFALPPTYLPHYVFVRALISA